MARKRKAIGGKGRLELRFDADLCEAVKHLAEKVGVSVNQLLEGSARWLVEHGAPGDAVTDQDGYVEEVRKEAGCVFFGEVDQDRGLGPVFFALDFSARRAVRGANELTGFAREAREDVGARGTRGGGSASK